jgi:hypothetical protein
MVFRVHLVHPALASRLMATKECRSSNAVMTIMMSFGLTLKVAMYLVRLDHKAMLDLMDQLDQRGQLGLKVFKVMMEQ